MATYEKRGNKVRVKIELQGVVESRTFENKTLAREWATTRESEILAGKNGLLPDKTFGDVIERYCKALDPVRRRADRLRLLKLFKAPVDPLTTIHVRDLNTTHVAQWRDRRLALVTAASVRREWNTISPAVEMAIHEWKWMANNPFRGNKRMRPPKPDDRKRRISPEEEALIRFCSQYHKDDVELVTARRRIGAAFLFALETGMRIGEIHNLMVGDVYLAQHHVKVTGAQVGGKKTRAAVREVPLSHEAERIIKQLLVVSKKGERVFRFSSVSNVDAVWRETIVAKSGVEDLHFHDTRHEAITRLARKMDLMDLALSLGIDDLKTLKVYYNPTSQEIAARLNKAA